MRSVSHKLLPWREQARNRHLQSGSNRYHLQIGDFSITTFEAKKRRPVQMEAANLESRDQILLSYPGMRSQS